jgi:hypothetical protein
MFSALPYLRSDELQLEEHDRINGGTPTTCTGLVHQLTHKGQIKSSFQVLMEVVSSLFSFKVEATDSDLSPAHA